MSSIENEIAAITNRQGAITRTLALADSAAMKNRLQAELDRLSATKEVLASMMVNGQYSL